MGKQRGIIGLGLGAGLMYLLDPRLGRRRRALARDQVVSLLRQAGNAVEPTGRDLGNRARGLLAEARGRLTSGEVSDEKLAARVRARLGRYVSHPGAIDVVAHQGRITLVGAILAHEVEEALAAVASVPGVQSVENQMTVHRDAGNIPELQGGVGRSGERFELLQENWSPTARLLVGTAGGALALYGAKQQGLSGTFLGGLGLGLLTRGITNLQFKRLLGVSTGRRALDIQKTIHVNAPVEEVYAFWSNFENFPRFMSHVRQVRQLGDGRSHWVVNGPAGTPVSWEAVTTVQEPNRVLAWRSREGAVVGNAGIIHFVPDDRGGTQINIKLSYNPPGGAIGHTVASFFGSDPKTAMDEDLVRFKSLIEQGRTTAGGETVTREEIEMGHGQTS